VQLDTASLAGIVFDARQCSAPSALLLRQTWHSAGSRSQAGWRGIAAIAHQGTMDS
jgi:hypothetical protein